MKHLTKFIILIITVFALSSCSTYNAPTKYQGRNLYKFSNKKRTVKSGKARSVKHVTVRKRGSYWHGAVTPGSRKEIRERWWSEINGGGQLYK